jgi:hypothetical protein
VVVVRGVITRAILPVSSLIDCIALFYGSFKALALKARLAAKGQALAPRKKPGEADSFDRAR